MTNSGDFGKRQETSEQFASLWQKRETTILLQYNFALSNQYSMDNKHLEHTGSNVLLTGCIFLANLDFSGLLDYAVKAIVGGGIWLGFKMTADYLERKRKGTK